MKKFQSNKSSVFSLNYHLVLVTKYRRKVLTDNKLPLLNSLISRSVDMFDCSLKEVGSDLDHVHILFNSKPTLNISNLVNNIKGSTSRGLRLKFPDLKSVVHHKYLWSPSYFIASTGGAPINIIEKYISNQGGA